jgi:hypothetical protein
MSRPIVAVLLVAASISISAPQTAEAQLGGLIKKKVKEAIKPPEKPAAAPAPAPAASQATQTESENSRGTGHGLPHVAGRSIKITRESLSRLMRGMDAELAMIADFEKYLAKWPTHEQYEACKVKAASTPEGKRIMSSMERLSQNSTPEQVMAAMRTMTEGMDALTNKHCPLNPGDWGPGRKSDRLEKIRAKAASLALPRSTASSEMPHESGPRTLLFEVSPYEMLPDTAADSITILGTGGFDSQEYGEMIERIVKYCDLKKSMDMTPKGSGLQVPGVGKDIYWIYVDEELETLKDLDCDSFRRKYKRLIGDGSQ